MATEKTSSESHDGDNLAEAGARAPAGGRWWNLAVTAGIVIALVVGVAALFRLDSLGTDTPTPERFQLDLAQQYQVPSDMLGYEEQGRWNVSLEHPVDFAVSGDGRILVAGDRAIAVFGDDGKLQRTIELENPPTCLAVAGPADAHPGRMYVGTEQGLLVLDASGETVTLWPVENDASLLTNVVVAGDRVLVADAGQRVVRCYDAEGTLYREIGQADADRQMPGFVIPSPYFDLVVDASEVVHVVNPGLRRVEAYNMEGELQSFWGRTGSGLPDFFGCCNPAYLALLPDGRFVTSEKGIPRIKVYSPGGELEQVVAGPEQLGISVAALGDARGNQHQRVFPLVVDRAGRIFVLDKLQRSVILFQPRGELSETRS